MDEMLEKLAAVAAEEGIDLSQFSNDEINEMLESAGLLTDDSNPNDGYTMKLAEAAESGRVMADAFMDRLAAREFIESLDDSDMEYMEAFEKRASEIAEALLVEADANLESLAGSSDDAVKTAFLKEAMEKIANDVNFNSFEKVASEANYESEDDLVVLRALEMLDEAGIDSDAVINLLG